MGCLIGCLLTRWEILVGANLRSARSHFDGFIPVSKPESLTCPCVNIFMRDTVLRYMDISKICRVMFLSKKAELVIPGTSEDLLPTKSMTIKIGNLQETADRDINKPGDDRPSYIILRFTIPATVSSIGYFLQASKSKPGTLGAWDVLCSGDRGTTEMVTTYGTLMNFQIKKEENSGEAVIDCTIKVNLYPPPL
ncbi:hypothetical protein CENSYa_1597 [Cenarchaeum symbiosum A]|uniref:Uncharacterized protein n=1 Tax=Cenarchaeum symbiosum (strain A) TaxID=414004 RepID=A0RY00_CENSY|nr:hypothetical protein CENSYa_1597 [Cenarchaeum symbiosum A]